MTQRVEGKLAGYAYLAYIVSAMSAAVLSGRTTAGVDTSRQNRLVPRSGRKHSPHR